jgi:hypothetical protein
MTVTVNLPAEIEGALRAEAQAKGVTVDELVRDVLVAKRPQSPLPRLSNEERLRLFRDWSASHGDITVVLPDEAMERDSIYGDDGR